LTTQQRSPVQSLWDFFCSLKLAIFLIIALAITSIIGTVLPQGTPPPEYLQSISEMKFKVYSSLGFFDMYHSWWYILLLYLFTVNLVACSIKRLPRVWKIITEPVLVMDENFEKTLSQTFDRKMEGNAATLKEKMTAFLKQEFAEPVVTEKDGEYHLFAQKNRWCRLGVYFTHLSIVVIFIGAIMGSLFGYKAMVNIVEGTSTDTVYARGDKPIKLDFALRLEKFSVSYYETGAPKEFKSILTVLDNGKPVEGLINRPTIVNDPLTYKGITFYQSSYGMASEGGVYHFLVRPRKGGAPVKVVARQGEQVALPGGGFFRVLEATQEVRQVLPQFSGPAARIEVIPSVGAQPQPPFIVLKNHPDLDELRGGQQVFVYEGADDKYFTGLQVAKDPGVWVVWFGCALMVIGISMAFFMSHTRVWIRVVNGRVVFGGTASKNPAAFQMRFEALVDKLKAL
jgi:cytochrome c biogenesis protein